MNNTFQILPVVREVVDLKKRGVNYIGLCPFHSKKTPSFTVSENKNIFKCFGCGEGGDAIQFQMKIDESTYEIAYSKLLQQNEKYQYSNDTLNFILNQIIGEFDMHIDSVDKLMNFDSTVIEFCISSLKLLEDRIMNSSNVTITNLKFLPTSTIQALENIKSNDSMKQQYTAIYNQCVVLLNSYFSTIVKDIFRKAVNYVTYHTKSSADLGNDNIKLSISELSKYDFNLKGHFGDILIAKADISFQDMQSIKNAFEKFLGIKIDRDLVVDTVILSQAARHCIVHSSEIADSKFFRQIRDISEREILETTKLNDSIEFDFDEIETIKNRMKEYLERLVNKLTIQIE